MIHRYVTSHLKSQWLNQPQSFYYYLSPVWGLAGLSQAVLTQGPSCSCRQVPAGARVIWKVSSLTWLAADVSGQLRPSGSDGPEHLQVASPCGLGFLTEWQLDSKSKGLKTVGREYLAFF